MVENQSENKQLDLSCHACGQHFETKSDLQDHQKTCTAQSGQGMNQAQTGGADRQNKSKQRQTSKSEQAQPAGQQEGGEKTRGAGSGGSWRGDSDV